MARRRYISTAISTDKAVNRLALKSDFAALLYTWLIPHAEDDATLSGDPEELLMTVMPGRRDKEPAEIEEALVLMAELQLIVWSPGSGRIAFPESFYKHQTYINAERRKSAHNSAERRTTAQNADEERESPTDGAERRFGKVEGKVKGFVIVEGQDARAQELLDLAVEEFPESGSSPEEIGKVIVRHLKREMGPQQIQRIIYELADWWPTNHKQRTVIHKTLNTWLQREEPVPDPPQSTSKHRSLTIDEQLAAYPTIVVPEDFIMPGERQ